MIDLRSIAGISAPYVLGIALASILSRNITCSYALCLASFIICLALLAFSLREKTPSWICFPLFFFLGLLTFLTHDLGVGVFPQSQGQVSHYIGHLTDRVDFRDDRTSPLIKALLLGDKSLLPREIVNSFRRSGAAHILALSGLHMGVIYFVLSKLLSPLGNSPKAWIARLVLTISLCGIYCYATGAAASIVRAYIFICVNEILKFFPQRRRDPLNVLCLALTVQLSLRPSDISSIGFQLSYSAMLGIFFFYPYMSSWYPQGGRANPFRKIWNSISMSLSCFLATAPLVYYRFGSLPLFFLLTNLIALPLTELLILSALFSIVSGEPLATDHIAGLLLDSLAIISSM